jgi:hypothetical protein
MHKAAAASISASAVSACIGIALQRHRPPHLASQRRCVLGEEPAPRSVARVTLRVIPISTVVTAAALATRGVRDGLRVGIGVGIGICTRHRAGDSCSVKSSRPVPLLASHVGRAPPPMVMTTTPLATRG